MKKRLILVLLLLALIGGGYRAMPAGITLPSLPISIGAGSANHMRDALIGLSADGELQQALATGRQRALGIPAVRESLLAQALAEQQALRADKTVSPALVDLDISLLEEAATTPPHDRRLALLLIQILEQAAEDPELRPVLAQTLNKLFSAPGRDRRSSTIGPDRSLPAQQ